MSPPKRRESEKLENCMGKYTRVRGSKILKKKDKRHLWTAPNLKVFYMKICPFCRSIEGHCQRSDERRLRFQTVISCMIENIKISHQCVNELKPKPVIK